MNSTDSSTRGIGSIIGIKFPSLTSKSLAGDKVTIPDSAKGCVTLITIAFMRKSQSQLDSWLEPYEQEFGGKAGFTFYEVPMMSIDYKFISAKINGGMRGGIPQGKHKNVVTYYGELAGYRRMLLLDDEYSGYAFVLDKEGIIRWMARGQASEEKINEMIETAKRLAQKK